jgi:hypothetical protein
LDQSTSADIGQFGMSVARKIIDFCERHTGAAIFPANYRRIGSRFQGHGNGGFPLVTRLESMVAPALSEAALLTITPVVVAGDESAFGIQEVERWDR